jgi:Ca2+-transporting ATPase
MNGGTSTPPVRTPASHTSSLSPATAAGKDRHGPSSARPSYSSLPFIPGTGRPATPPVADYAFSTTLRRQSVGEHDGPGHGLSNFLAQNAPSSLRNIVGSGDSALLPTHAPSHDRRGSGPSAHHHQHHPFAHTAGVTTPSARFARCSITETADQLHTNLDTGLSSNVVPAIREINGPNEFEVARQERVLTKFLKQFYESPLIILLLASALVSAVVGNLDDAFSITLAIVIVVTGKLYHPSCMFLSLRQSSRQSVLYRSNGRRRAWRL